MSTLGKIKELKALRDSGDLTDEEFAQAKTRLLNEPPAATSLGWVYPLLIVVIVGLVFWITPQKKPGTKLLNNGEENSTQTNPTVKPQHTYYIFPDLIELAATNPEGKEWDIDDSGPDITYAIHLNDREIFTAPSKGKDNTVNEWGGMSQDLSLFNTSVSVEGIIKAALVSINAGDTLKFKVWDNDIAANDEAGEFTIMTTELKLGQTEWWCYGDTWNEDRDASRPDASRGLKRLRLRVIDSEKKAEFIASQLNLPLEKVNDMLKKLAP